MGWGLHYISNNFLGYGDRDAFSPSNIDAFLSKVQFERLAHDIKMWRDSIREAELAFNPYRVKQQRMYNDTIVNPEVQGMIERWEDLTLQRDYCIYQNKGGVKVESNDLTQQLEEQIWFQTYLKSVLNAYLFGYETISLGDIEEDSFPYISFLQRENVRITEDGEPIMSSLVYGLDGISLQKYKDDKDLIPLFNHFIPSKQTTPYSKVGYGLLYGISFLEIHLRHTLEWNMDYIQQYGHPIKKGFTRKTGKQRLNFEAFLRSAASNSWILLDKSTDDDVMYETAKEAGTAWKVYGDMDVRLKGSIAKNLFGHEDAMQSLPGKLGGMQAANKDGFNESLIEQAINSKQIRIGNYVSGVINQISATKFRKLGSIVGSRLISNLIPKGYHFSLKNDKEEYEIQKRKNAQRTVVSTYAKDLNTAGWDIDQTQLEKELGFKLTAATPETKSIQERTIVSKSEE